MLSDERRDAGFRLGRDQNLQGAPGTKHATKVAIPVGPGPAPESALDAPVAGGEVGLVERARSGDAAAFDALVALRLMPTFRLARAILGSTEEAEDATQEAFIAAWRGLPSLREPERFDAWFGRIVVNACRMSMRRRPRTIVVPLDAVTPRQSDSADDPWLSGVIDSDALSRAIDGLALQHRAILALYYLEDRPMASVAAILGIPSGTAKWRLSQARSALRTAMAAGDERAPVFAGQPAGLQAAQAPVPLSGDSA
jgi:RNA polymerase sigma-70 factor (ECF subfamily)